MIVRLENGNTEIVNNRNDLRGLVSDEIFDAIDKLIDKELLECMEDVDTISVEEARELNDDNTELERDLDDACNERNRLEEKLNEMEYQIRKLKELNNEYKNSKSKRIDKETLTNKLDEIIKGLTE